MMDANDARKETWKDRLRAALPVIATAIGYMIPLFWLWSITGHPDALGVHIAAHGKAGLLENGWYSYLLLQRHLFSDVATFAYMWLAMAGVIAWMLRVWLVDRHATRKGGPA